MGLSAVVGAIGARTSALPFLGPSSFGSTFKKKDRTEMNVVEYYKTRYGQDITDMSQPLLIQKQYERDKEGKEAYKGDSYFVPELMMPTGMTDAMRAGRQLMTKLADLFHSDARRKMVDLRKIVTSRICNISQLNDWRISVGDMPGMFHAYRIANPPLDFANRSLEVNSNRDWNTDLRNVTYLKMCPLTHWTAIVPPSCSPDFDSFVQELERHFRCINVDFDRLRIVDYTTNDFESIAPQLKNNDLVFAVVNSEFLYESVLKFCVCEFVTTQCIKPQTLRRPVLTPIITMITLQMQGKIGGIHWNLRVESSFAEGTMTVGIDVISAGKEREIVVIVSSIDNGMTRNKKRSVVPKKGLHIAGIHIGEFMKEALESYRAENSVLPKCFIIYRGSS